MTTLRIKRYALVSMVFWVSLRCFGTDTDSILDKAAASREFGQALIAEYQSSTNDFRDDRLLAVGIAYIGEDLYEKARPVYEQFLRDHPDHSRALRGMGTVNLYQNRTNEAIACYAKAWSQGDVNSLGALAALYVNLGKFTEIEPLIPELIAHKQGDPDIPPCLLACALSKDLPREDLILEALDGIPDSEITSRKDTTQLIDLATSQIRALDENNKTLQTICRKIVRGYLFNTNAWPEASLSGVGGAYFFLHDYRNAELIYRQVLIDQPDNRAALSGLGAICMMQHKFPEAIMRLRKAWSLGEKIVLSNLSAAYLASQDFDGMKDLIPSLLERKGENMELLNSLLGYSLAKSPMDKELFYKAIAGVSDDQILRRPDTTDTVLKGLKWFGDEEHFRRLLKKKQVQDQGLGG